MNKYVSPEFKVTVFDSLDSVFAASNTTSEKEPTKQEVSGDGPGIVLPDDDF